MIENRKRRKINKKKKKSTIHSSSFDDSSSSDYDSSSSEEEERDEFNHHHDSKVRKGRLVTSGKMTFIDLAGFSSSCFFIDQIYSTSVLSQTQSNRIREVEAN